MRCPYCAHDEDKVMDSRPTDEGYAIRRRRECVSCGKRFTTYEKVEDMPLMVVKKDDSRQSYNREKLLKGLEKACEKRPVSRSQLEKIADVVEGRILDSIGKEISTEEIGDIIMDNLKQLDDVAYVRFASVYRQFKDISSFLDELQKMVKESK